MASIGAHPLLQESIWFDKRRYEEAERLYHERLYQQKCGAATNQACPSTLVNEIKRAREHIQKSMEPPASPAKVIAPSVPKGGQDAALAKRIGNLENENKDLRKVTEDLRTLITKMEARISALEKSSASVPAGGKPSAPAPVKKEEANDDEDDDDDDLDLFGSDDEEEEAERERIKQQRVQEYEAKKTKKPAVIAKSNVIIDVKPWDDETDMKKTEELVRTIEMDGLRWGASKLVDLAYGIKKLQICCIIEDAKVSTEDLEDRIKEFEDYVQSTDIAAFQKV